MRVYAMMTCPPDIPRCASDASEQGYPLIPGPTSKSHLTVRTVKLFVDGALGSWGSAMWEPYSDKPEDSGLLLIPEDELKPLVKYWVDAEWQVAAHAIGDRANTLVLQAFDAIRAPQKYRLRIEHMQIIRPEDADLAGKVRVVASMQPTHCTSDMKYVESRIGEERKGGAYAWQSLAG